ncbi:peptide chain release factor N(5)-glutamine methyltransferase [Mariprofundus sp. EBB-1]|uniref:peptide chain release factor N(5)-glutamine methyltransferase n=1 Tax=Mariprofundus sp. EBB-1 TaxID=2650971 RepID=UPI000EF230C1|nr:peptide chain release factor N(5)-glutamine methyltransferase [Mariprofundus sp. EBB-1]RLL51591.1 peptide chain release factor N(5)-glutamine methyltransferase [Mariprofundus sp. EBB-1]
MSHATTLRQLIQQASALLKQVNCDAPMRDAELLLMSVWGMRRTDLIIRASEPVPEAIETVFNALIQRRMQREPLAYILGEKEFWSRPFHVTSDVLVPRPETEHLIEAVLEYFPDQQGAYNFCDIGTGSGIIAVTLACEYPKAHIIATDISESALRVATGNAIQHKVEDRITFKQGDMLQAIEQRNAHFDAIISNPPYVAEHEMASLEQELSYEPRNALTDESDGLTFLTDILNTGPEFLQTSGMIMLETGPCGLPDTPETLIFEKVIHDLAGHARGGIYRCV